MKYELKHLHCGDNLLKSQKREIDEIEFVIESVKWEKEKEVNDETKIFKHQSAYNKIFENEFEKLNWNKKPMLSKQPRLIGDFQKGLVFIEVQFGNSATLYRDFYKFQYGFQKGLLSLSVLIVPKKPTEFFPNRGASVSNMAEYELALRYFTILPISVPTILIGLESD